jgi:hypothetical protein
MTHEKQKIILNGLKYTLTLLPDEERNFDGITIRVGKNWNFDNTYKIYKGVNNGYDLQSTYDRCKYTSMGFSQKDIEEKLEKGDWIEVKEEVKKPIPILSLPDGNGGLYHLYEGDTAYRIYSYNGNLTYGYNKIVVGKCHSGEDKKIFPTEELAMKRLNQIEKRYSEEDILTAIQADHLISTTHSDFFKWRLQKSLNFKGYPEQNSKS